MFINRIKLLTPFEFVKVSIPIIALLSVFFIKTMLTSNIQNIYQKKLQSGQSEQSINIDNDDKKFITALLEQKDIIQITPFQLRNFSNNSFISGFYNKIKPEKPVERKQERYTFVPAPMAPLYIVSAVFNGRYRRYAVINNTITAPGDILSNGDRIIDVRDGRVLISGIWGKQWFYVTY